MEPTDHQTFVPETPQVRVEDIVGAIPYVLAVVPTYTPKNFQQCFALYKSGGTLRLYVYNTTTATWAYASLT